jgi:MFS family permease
VGYLIIGVGFGMNYFAHTVTTLAICMGIFTFGEMVTMPMVSAYVANLAPADMRGRYLGVSGLTWSLALILGPGLGMKLFSYSEPMYWLASSLISVIAAVIILVATKPQAEAYAKQIQ